MPFYETLDPSDCSSVLPKLSHPPLGKFKGHLFYLRKRPFAIPWRWIARLSALRCFSGSKLIRNKEKLPHSLWVDMGSSWECMRWDGGLELFLAVSPFLPSHARPPQHIVAWLQKEIRDRAREKTMKNFLLISRTQFGEVIKIKAIYIPYSRSNLNVLSSRASWEAPLPMQTLWPKENLYNSAGKSILQMIFPNPQVAKPIRGRNIKKKTIFLCFVLFFFPYKKRIPISR